MIFAVQNEDSLCKRSTDPQKGTTKRRGLSKGPKQLKGYSCFLSSSTLFLVSFRSGSISPLASTVTKKTCATLMCVNDTIKLTKID